MTSDEQQNGEFVWPYRTREDIGPFGDSPEEMRQVERLYQAVRHTEIAMAKTANIKRGLVASPGIVTDTLVNLEDVA